LGLDRGGACLGLAFRVCGSERDEVIEYLRAREQVTNVYREEWRAIRFDDGSRATALTYVVDRNHAQYAGKLDLETQVAMIAAAIGQSGANPDYVTSTAQRLEELGIRDHGLASVSQRLLAIGG
jgi:cation transport protein ChaC